jgi:uncharacterized membrane protein
MKRKSEILFSNVLGLGVLVMLVCAITVLAIHGSKYECLTKFFLQIFSGSLVIAAFGGFAFMQTRLKDFIEYPRLN